MLNPFQECVPEPPEPPFEVAFVNPGFQDSKPLAAYPGKVVSHLLKGSCHDA